MNIARTKRSINKTEAAGRKDAQIGFADALQRVFLTALARYSNVVAGSARRLCATEFSNIFW